MELKNKQLIIETTNLCDAKCITCPRERFTQKPCTMGMDLFRKIIDDGAQYGIESVDLCGYGEPLLDKHLLERFRYIREKLPGASIFMSTTGFHLTPDKWEWIAQYVDILKFSFYGVTKDVYESMHGGKLRFQDSILHVMGFLCYCQYVDRKPHTIGLYLDTSINTDEANTWVGMWEPICDEVMVWKPHNWIIGREYRPLDTEHQKSCGRPFNAPMYIHADGTVSPCCFDNNKMIRLGNLTHQTIEEVYKGEAYRSLRDAHESKDFRGYACRDCDQTNYNPDVLVYSSNRDRKVGQLVSNGSDIQRERGLCQNLSASTLNRSAM